MKPPACEDIARVIASSCLIKKDRAGRALFISDFIIRTKNPQEIKIKLQNQGFVCCDLDEHLVLIDWTRDHYIAYLNYLPKRQIPPFDDSNAMAYGTCRLLMEHEATLDKQDVDILSLCLRLALLGQKKKMLQTLQSDLADALREMRAPPYHGARICMEFLWQQKPLI